MEYVLLKLIYFFYERNFPMCAQLLSTQPYKGTRDFYPEDMQLRNWFFGKISEALRLASFEEYSCSYSFSISYGKMLNIGYI